MKPYLDIAIISIIIVAGWTTLFLGMRDASMHCFLTATIIITLYKY